MERNLHRHGGELYHVVNGIKVDGASPNLSGDCSGLSGNCSGLWGNCSALRGDCSGLRGDLDSCGLTDEDRARGVSIADLVVE